MIEDTVKAAQLPPKNSNQQVNDIIGIQYLRGIAAIAVVIDHSSGMANLPKYFGIELFDGFLKSGARGVDIFFIISGFIMVVSSLKSDLAPKLSVLQFLTRRAQRILPLMWLGILSYALLRLASRGEWDPVGTLTALTLFPAGHVTPTVIWTLRLELIFYIVFALSILRQNRYISLFLFWAISPFLLSFFAPALNLSGIDADESSLSLAGFINNIFHPANIEFSVGVIIGAYYIKNRKNELGTWFINPAFLLTILFFGFMLISFHLGLKFNNINSALISSIFAGSIVALAAYAKPQAGFWNYTFTLLGDASYAIYLFHSHVISAILGVLARHAKGLPIGAVLLICILSSILAGIAVHKVVEVPLVRWAKSFSGRPGKA